MVEDPVRTAALIAAAMADLPEPRLHWVRPVPGYEVPSRARATGRPRLTIVVAGARRVLAPVDGVVAERRLRPGDVLVVPADGWSAYLSGTPNLIIAINCDDQGTQFEAPVRPGLPFHSGGPLNPAAWSLLNALVQLGAEPAQRALGPTVLRATVAAALADCRPWPQADRARLAWTRARACARERLDAGRDQLAAAAGVHPNHLSRLCRRFEGTSLIAWLTTLRMERARALLQSGFAATAVAPACGYAEASHFRRTFRAWHGQPPAAWMVAARLGGRTVPA